ncbi:hypothetical protein GCM10010254_33200 [Streptomyces chromofuscus]|nr:hypothetical protein GCM10010254_33200 [Streptomyces chromofuscus]
MAARETGRGASGRAARGSGPSECAAAAAVLGAAAPAAVAGGTASNSVGLLGVIARGGRMTITVDGCPRGGTTSSEAFSTATLSPINDTDPSAQGGRVRVLSKTCSWHPRRPLPPHRWP